MVIGEEQVDTHLQPGWNRWLYVDKTRFLRRLEEERYAFLIRPRRFGKSLWISLLENYYDRFWADGLAAASAQPAATANAVTLRVSRLNSTPIRWMGWFRWRYLAA